MESPFLCTAAYRLQPDHLNTDLSTTFKKIPRYLGELVRQMANRFIALHYFHGVFDHGVVKLSFSNKFFFDRWLPHNIHAQLIQKQAFHFYVQTSLITKQTLCKRYASFSFCFFRANSIAFISTAGFNNEDNCCQSPGIGKLIRKKLLKGIFRVH